jgi:hypothetical protein
MCAAVEVKPSTVDFQGIVDGTTTTGVKPPTEVNNVDNGNNGNNGNINGADVTINKQNEQNGANVTKQNVTNPEKNSTVSVTNPEQNSTTPEQNSTKQTPTTPQQFENRTGEFNDDDDDDDDDGTGNLLEQTHAQLTSSLSEIKGEINVSGISLDVDSILKIIGTRY